MKIALYTLGCKLNQCETEAIARVLKQGGNTLTSIKLKADLYIVNTCTVTSKSEQKARRIIRLCVKKNTNALIIVTGCYTQLEPEMSTNIHENVIAVPQDKKDKLLDFFAVTELHDFELLTPFEQKHTIINFIEQRSKTPYNPFAFLSENFQFHSRAFLKIQDGCDCGCVYCRVPLARGGSVSLCPDDIVTRIRQIKHSGYKEIVLTGVNISAYNHSNTGIHELLESIILPEGEGIRFRLSSLEPEVIDKGLANILSHPKICPHFHIPVQSGSDHVLKAMKRRYNAAQVKEAIRLLKEAKPDCFLGADILTGFPGETEEDHQLSVHLMERCGFSRLHVFRFSPRPGTPAYTMKPKVPGRVAKIRLSGLLDLSERLFNAYVSLWKGKKVNIILEKKCIPGDNGEVVFEGLSGNYLRYIVTNIPQAFAYKGNLVSCYIEKPGNPGLARFVSGNALPYE